MGTVMEENSRLLVYDYFRKYGRAPHIGEFQTELKITRIQAEELIKRLDEKGVIHRFPGCGSFRIVLPNPFSNLISGHFSHIVNENVDLEQAKGFSRKQLGVTYYGN